jgi:hypothetical protein
MENNIWLSRLRVFVLVFLVALSLFFTISVWQHPISSSKTEDETQQVKETSSFEEKNLFLASQAINHHGGSSEVLIGDHIVKELQTLISDIKVKKIEETQKMPLSRYQETITSGKQIELSYPFLFTIDSYVKYFELELNTAKLPQKQFNRVLVDLDNRQLCFYNDTTKTKATITCSIDKEKFNKVINSKDLTRLPVGLTNLNNQLVYLYQSDITLKKYNYIFNLQVQNRYKNIFLGKNNEIQTIDNQDGTTYIGSDSKRLTINETTGVVAFKEAYKGTQKALENSIDALKLLSNDISGLRLFSKTANTIQYNTFIEGFPIINADYKGQIAFSLEQNKAIQSITTNLETIQVPLPADATVTLPPTEAIINQLYQAHPDLKINNLIIGYSWHNLAENAQVVEMTPQWFVNIDNQWQAVSDVLREETK